MQTTSPSLLMRLRDPDQAEAWSRFVRLYSPMLYTWAKKMGLQHADAIDLMQDVFVQLYKKLPEFNYDQHRRFRGWLWTVTRNKWREKRRRKSPPIEDEAELEKLPNRTEESVEEAEFKRHVLMEILPSYQSRYGVNAWRAFWEQAINGKSAPQVAEELGMTSVAAYKAKVRILARLHQELGDLLTD